MLNTLILFILFLTNLCATPSQTKKYFTKDSSKMAFSQPVEGMSYDEEDKFVLGKSFFSIPWVQAPSATTARDGLGPLFSANTCMHCHPRNGAGISQDKKGKMHRSYLLRLSHKNPLDLEALKIYGFEPDSMYGAQLSQNGNQNVPSEAEVSLSYEEIAGTYPDGEKYTLRKPSYIISNKNYGDFDKDTIFAPRKASALIGLGLLESISEEDILKFEDINDSNNDGISGKANYAYNPESKKVELGRFTWKASATTVKHQSAGAAHNDMGLSNPLFPSDNCSPKQIECLKEAQKSKDLLATFDLPQKRLDAVAYYVSNLAVPIQRNPNKHKEGEALFKSLSCTACHVPKHQSSYGVAVLAYTDLLLHDMGEDLADGRSEFLANGKEWRTAPLWGIGLYKKVSSKAHYLHDGRARSIEEAILWHGGEALKSKKSFINLNKQSREKVLRFLNSI